MVRQDIDCITVTVYTVDSLLAILDPETPNFKAIQILLTLPGAVYFTVETQLIPPVIDIHELS